MRHTPPNLPFASVRLLSGDLCLEAQLPDIALNPGNGAESRSSGGSKQHLSTIGIDHGDDNIVRSIRRESQTFEMRKKADFILDAELEVRQVRVWQRGMSVIGKRLRVVDRQLNAIPI